MNSKQKKILVITVLAAGAYYLFFRNKSTSALFPASTGATPNVNKNQLVSLEAIAAQREAQSRIAMQQDLETAKAQGNTAVANDIMSLLDYHTSGGTSSIWSGITGRSQA